MQIKLINCMAKLQAQGIDIYEGSGVDLFTSKLNELTTVTFWSYDFANDVTTINIPNGMVVPLEISYFGDVME